MLLSPKKLVITFVYDSDRDAYYVDDTNGTRRWFRLEQVMGKELEAGILASLLDVEILTISENPAR